MYNDRDPLFSAREQFRFMGVTAGWWIFIIVLALATTFIGYQFAPYFMQKETQVIRNSNPYITSQQEALLTMKASYDDLTARISALRAAKNPAYNQTIRDMQGQQAGIVRQMRLEAAKIPGYVPTDVQMLLSVQ